MVAGSYRQRLRVLITTREPEGELDPRRPHWCFFIEKSDDLRSHRKIIQTFLGSSVIPEISQIIHCSNCSEYWFEHRRNEEVFKLGSCGPHLCGDVKQISVSYPQRGLSFAKLENLEGQDHDLLSEKEREIVEERLSAMDIGGKMFYGTEETQFEFRGWECWSLEAGKAELTSLDGAPFVVAQAEAFPEALQQLERKIERAKERYSRS